MEMFTYRSPLHIHRETRKKITNGALIVGGVGLAVLGKFACDRYPIERDGIENSRVLVNKIRLGAAIKDGEFQILVGKLVNAGGTVGGSGSDCHFDFYIDADARPGYEPIKKLKVIVSYPGYNNESSKMGESFVGIVAGQIHQNPYKISDSDPDYLIGGYGEKGEGVVVARTWTVWK